MALTTLQLSALKAAILADGTLSAYPNTIDGNLDMASQKLNVTASPSFKVWSTRVPVSDIFDAITWSNYTPADAADASVTFSNRLMVINVKQMNLQNMVIGRDFVNASKSNIRAGLRDAVIQLPSGASGAAVSAGGASGVTVLTACLRDALLIEKILTAGSQTTGTVAADVMGFEGQISGADVAAARNS
jgi:hypothetical protein